MGFKEELGYFGLVFGRYGKRWGGDRVKALKVFFFFN